jgi:hypothetical protein
MRIIDMHFRMEVPDDKWKELENEAIKQGKNTDVLVKGLIGATDGDGITLVDIKIRNPIQTLRKERKLERKEYVRANLEKARVNPMGLAEEMKKKGMFAPSTYIKDAAGSVRTYCLEIMEE